MLRTDTTVYKDTTRIASDLSNIQTMANEVDKREKQIQRAKELLKLRDPVVKKRQEILDEEKKMYSELNTDLSINQIQPLEEEIKQLNAETRDLCVQINKLDEEKGRFTSLINEFKRGR